MTGARLLRLPVASLLLLCAATCARGEGEWRTWDDCQLIPNESNDGDSFHVRHGRRHYIFRLYFVDAPESEDSLPDRIAEQADYWKIDAGDITRLGKRASAFTQEFLKDGFTVETRLEDVQGRSDRPRHLALVSVKGVSLADALVSNGLARVFGIGTDLQDGTPERKVWSRLHTTERRARERKAGAWGLPPTDRNSKADTRKGKSEP